MPGPASGCGDTVSMASSSHLLLRETAESISSAKPARRLSCAPDANLRFWQRTVSASDSSRRRRFPEAGYSCEATARSLPWAPRLPDFPLHQDHHLRARHHAHDLEAFRGCDPPFRLHSGGLVCGQKLVLVTLGRVDGPLHDDKDLRPDQYARRLV